MKEFKFKGTERVSVSYTVIADTEEEAIKKLPKAVDLSSSKTLRGPQMLRNGVIRDMNPQTVLDLDSLEMVDVKDPYLDTCPFCKSEPSVYVDDDAAPEYRVHIYCADKDCPVSVEVYAPTLGEAAQKWNTRRKEKKDA